ncbi:MAG: type II secretion system major pseudopilin GspG [Desulfarculaceae bacterium]
MSKTNPKMTEQGESGPVLKKKRRQAGFTLLELLIVVIILGLLAALVGPRLFRTLEKAQWKVAKTQIELLASALDHFRLDVGRYPTTEEGLDSLVTPRETQEGWDGPYLPKGVPKDPWGREYIYISPSEHAEFEIMSLGQDGKPGGSGEDKDISSRT